MFSDYVDVDPALAVDQFCSPDVVHVPIAVGLVLLAVIIETDPWLVIAHVDKCLAHAVADSDLGARRWEPIVAPSAEPMMGLGTGSGKEPMGTTTTCGSLSSDCSPS